MTDKTTKPFPMRLNISDVNQFQSIYPRCLSKFIKKCLRMANQDLKFFEYVFFSEVK